MLVMHKPDAKDGNTTVPFYIPLSRVPTVHKFDLEKVCIAQKPLTLNIDKQRHKLDNSKEDVLKNSVQNGTILEEDRFQSDDPPSDSTNTEVHQEIDYSSHSNIHLATVDATNHQEEVCEKKEDEEKKSEEKVDESKL